MQLVVGDGYPKGSVPGLQWKNGRNEMALMQFSEGSTFTKSIAPAGTYVCKFKEVRMVTVKNNYPDAKTDTIDKLVWEFETTEVGDSESNPFVFSVWTSTYYGGDKSTLTKFIDMIFGQRFQKSELGAVEAKMPSLVYNLKVSVGTSQAGKEYNNIDSCILGGAVKKLAATEVITDPFAE